MALFGKSNNLGSILKKVEALGSAGSPELENLIELIEVHPDFQIQKNLWMFSHANKTVRECAGRMFVSSSDPGLADTLIKAMAGRTSGVRQEIARLVIRVAPNRVQARLGPMVHSTSLEQKQAALDLISQHGKWQEYLPYLKVTIRDSHTQIRHHTARLLAKGIDNPTILLILREFIHDEDSTLRRIIIEAFSRRPNADIVEPFFERLPLEGPEERIVMVRALSQLARTRQDQIESRVLPMLGDENPETRETAVKLLGEMPDRTRVLKTFLMHCQGLAFWLRDRSMESIRKMSDNFTEPLVTLLKDEILDVRVGAMIMAKGSTDPRLLPGIQDILLGKHDWWIRSMAADTLAQFPGQEVTSLLLSRLDDGELRYSVISVLGQREEPAALSALIECLRDPKRGIRMATVNALGTRKTQENLNTLSRVALEDPDEGVRERAETVLQEFGTESHELLQKITARKRRLEKETKQLPAELQMANEELNP